MRWTTERPAMPGIYWLDLDQGAADVVSIGHNERFDR